MPFPSDKDYKKINKIINNIQKLAEKRSETKIERKSKGIKFLPDKVMKGIRMVRAMKEFYDLLDESLGGITLEKLKKLDIEKYTEELIKSRFGTGGESRLEGRSPEEFFDNVIKNKVYKSLEEEDLPSEKLQKARESLEKAREKILSFGVLEADSVTSDQILYDIDNPYRCIEIIEKMAQDLAESVISEIFDRVTIKDKKLALKIAELVKAAQDCRKKYIVEGFNKVGFELLAKIIETQHDQSYDVVLFTDICQILPVEILRKGYDEKIDKSIVNLKEIEVNQQRAFNQYNEMEKEGKEIAEKIYREIEEDINNTLRNMDIPLQERVKRVNEIASEKLAKFTVERLSKEGINPNG